MSSATRIDRWLWSVRAYKTRAAAQKACAQGRVTIDGDTAKPARKVVPGDTITIRLHDRIRILEVVDPIDKRVGAALAAEAFVDHSPPEPERAPSLPPIPGGFRERGAGRPTKRDRRRLEKFREQDR